MLAGCGGRFYLLAKCGRIRADFRASLQEYTIRLTEPIFASIGRWIWACGHAHPCTPLPCFSVAGRCPQTPEVYRFDFQVRRLKEKRRMPRRLPCKSCMPLKSLFSAALPYMQAKLIHLAHLFGFLSRHTGVRFRLSRPTSYGT